MTTTTLTKTAGGVLLPLTQCATATITIGSAVTPSCLRWRMRGTVRRRIGAGVGLARLVEVSSWKVVDMSGF